MVRVGLCIANQGCGSARDLPIREQYADNDETLAQLDVELR
jgi:hypothetical protein